MAGIIAPECVLGRGLSDAPLRASSSPDGGIQDAARSLEGVGVGVPPISRTVER